MAKPKTSFTLEIVDAKGNKLDSGGIDIVECNPKGNIYVAIVVPGARYHFMKDEDLLQFAKNILRLGTPEPKTSRKLTATEKRLIREYVTPHTVEDAAKKFNVQLTRVRAIMTKGKHVSPEKSVKRSGKSYRKPANRYLYLGAVDNPLNVAR